MSLKIRLARGGSKKRPYYQIVVADARAPRDGRFLDKVGSWNPMLGKDNEKRVELDVDAIKAWVEKGAQPTDRVARFLSQDEALADKVKWTQSNNPNKAQPGKKAQERAAERAQRDDYQAIDRKVGNRKVDVHRGPLTRLAQRAKGAAP